MGVVAASDVGCVALADRLIARTTAEAARVAVLEAVQHALSGDAANVDRPVIRWAFPTFFTPHGAIARVPATDWADAWTNACRTLQAQPRVRVTRTPAAEPVRPWYQLLTRTTPPPAAVTMEVEPPLAQLFVDWPLRLASLPDNRAARAIAAARTHPALESLTAAIRIGRDEANSDVLVHIGSPEDLLIRLRALPVSPKTDLIVIAGAPEMPPLRLASTRDEILKETHASGIVLTQPSAALDLAIADFVSQLAHNAPFDCALFAGFTARRGPFAMWLSPALSNLGLIDIARRINRRAEVVGASPAAKARALKARERSDREPHERHDANAVAAVARRVRAAEDDAGTPEAPRFLQQQAFVRNRRALAPATRGFVAGREAVVKVRIGPADSDWNSLPDDVPVERLPQDVSEWRLTVWLTEPHQLDRPLRTSIVLPRRGTSTEGLFRFAPLAAGSFEGRVTVLHRGRVLQTAVLRAGVRNPGGTPVSAPALEKFVPVRQGLGDLDRRQFDLAYVLNRSAAGTPVAVALSDRHAWISDLSKALAVAKNINIELGKVADSVDDYRKGLGSTNGRTLLIRLAREGSWLHLYLVKQQLQALGNRAGVADADYIQIVSTKTDAVVPFEFIYDQAPPLADAALCGHWRRAAATGSGKCRCNKKDKTIVCPLGFWGLSKVIERHAIAPALTSDGKELYLQSEPRRKTKALHLGGTALVAHSARVKAGAIRPLISALRQRLGVTPRSASTWAEWLKAVDTVRPRLLVALPHTDGSGARVSLEIGGEAIETLDVVEGHVCIPPDGPPLVALLGCDTMGTANDYGEHVAIFRDRGAAVVIGTIATVFGEHAAQVGRLLVEEILPPDGTPPSRLGEAIRSVKRRGLAQNLLMPLCLVAYGDADWHLVR